MCMLLFHDICPTGNSYQSLYYQFRIGRTTIGKIIPYTCSAIYRALNYKYIKVYSWVVYEVMNSVNNNKKHLKSVSHKLLKH